MNWMDFILVVVSGINFCFTCAWLNIVIIVIVVAVKRRTNEQQ